MMPARPMAGQPSPSAPALPDAARSPVVGYRPGRRNAYAALDLGTNNCRLLIAEPASHGFRVVDAFSRIVRLGEGLGTSDRLSEAAVERTLEALRVCRAKMESRGVARAKIIATEACRLAVNGADFVARVRDEVGLDLEIVDRQTEAYLAVTGCAALADPYSESVVIFDIGGGSTEIAWVRLSDNGAQPELIGYRSLPLGVMTVAEQVGDAAFTPAGYESMVTEVTEQLLGFEAVHCIGREVAGGRVRMIGTSGTVTTLASIALRLPRYSRNAVDGVALPAGAAIDAAALLRRLGLDGLRAHGCIGPERAALVLPGCAIFEAIHRIWPCDRVVVADRGLRDGMLLRMMRDRSPHLAATVADASVFAASSPGRMVHPA